jgi:hypothetical protein
MSNLCMDGLCAFIRSVKCRLLIFFSVLNTEYVFMNSVHLTIITVNFHDKQDVVMIITVLTCFVNFRLINFACICMHV